MRLRSVHDVNEVAMRRKWFKGSLATWDEGIWSMERVCCRNAGWLISDVTVQYHGTHGSGLACAGPNIEPSPKMSHVARSGSGRECHSSTILIQRLVRILTHRRKSTPHRHSHRVSLSGAKTTFTSHGPWILCHAAWYSCSSCGLCRNRVCTAAQLV